jgi:uncharacterized protein YhaN
MRFDRLTIRAFGQFTDYAIPFDTSKNFHLLFGLNEAGKSTALRAITDFLYGIPSRTTDSFLHDNGSLRIEGQIRKSGGKTLQFVRRKGNKHTVLDLDGHPLNEDRVSDFLNGLTEKHFLNMFALDHVRMREGGEELLQSGGNLGESLFSAASGITQLRKVLERLEDQSGAIFKKRASTPKLNKLLKEEKELNKEITDRQLKVQTWKALEKSFAEGKKEIEKIKKTISTLRTRKAVLERMKLTLPKLAKLKDLELKLADLGDVPDLPEDTQKVRTEAQYAFHEAKKDRQRAEDDRRELITRRNKIAIPDGLLEQASLIDAQYRELRGYQTNLSRIPALEGERKQLEAQVISSMKELDPAHAEAGKMDLFRLPAEKKEMIHQLCKQRPLLDQTLAATRSDLGRLTEALHQKQKQLDGIAEQPDIQAMEHAVDKVRRAGEIDVSIRNLEKKLQQKQRQVDSAMKQLPLWNGTVQELTGHAFPILTETVKKYAQEKDKLDQEMQKKADQIQAQKEQMEHSQEQIRELELQAKIPSEEELHVVRNHRDQGWRLIRTKLEKGSWEEGADAYSGNRAIEDVYEENVRKADHVADHMRTEAAKVGAKDKYLLDIETSKNKIVQLKTEQAHLTAETDHWRDSWKKQWAPFGITPLTPAEMAEWLSNYEQIRTMAQESAELRAELDVLEKKRSELSRLLRNVLTGMMPVDEGASLEDLLTQAENLIRKIRTSVNARNSLKASLADGRQHEKELTDKLKDNEVQLQAWKANWQKAIQGTCIQLATPPNIAEELLGRYEQLVKQGDQLQEVMINQEKVKNQVRSFEEKTRNLLRSVPAVIDAPNCSVAIGKFYAALQQARKDQETLRGIQERLDKSNTRIKAAVRKSEEAAATLNDLIQQAGCETVAELEQAEKNNALRKREQAAIHETKEELLQIGGGLSLAELTREVEAADKDSIEAELGDIQHTLDELEPRQSQLEQNHGAVKRDYEEKIQGNSTASVLAEQKKESVLAEIAHVTDQYIQFRLAFLLLQKGIEQYRNRNQDPILRRAGELFSRLTLHSFTGLTVDYDEKDQPVLMGTRENGGKVALQGMSDGTTDQLYLSLRLASIERYIRQNEPIPFIVDDILIHFDDLRAKETLKVLLELSEHTQIIFFTHHERLVDMMREISSGEDYQLFELNAARESITK